jgi:hypothetical protein
LSYNNPIYNILTSEIAKKKSPNPLIHLNQTKIRKKKETKKERKKASPTWAI